MAKQSAVARASRPLEGSVRTVGVRPRFSLTERDVAVADLSISLTGGTRTARTPITFSVGLNAPLAARARAQLINEATQSRIAVATRSGGAYVFKNVPVVPPGTGRTRVFRITNIRANGSALANFGTQGTTPVLAFITVSAPLRIALAGAQQTVAVARRS